MGLAEIRVFGLERFQPEQRLFKSRATTEKPTLEVDLDSDAHNVQAADGARSGVELEP